MDEMDGRVRFPRLVFSFTRFLMAMVSIGCGSELADYLVARNSSSWEGEETYLGTHPTGSHAGWAAALVSRIKSRMAKEPLHHPLFSVDLLALILDNQPSAMDGLTRTELVNLGVNVLASTKPGDLRKPGTCHTARTILERALAAAGDETVLGLQSVIAVSKCSENGLAKVYLISTKAQQVREGTYDPRWGEWPLEKLIESNLGVLE